MAPKYHADVELETSGWSGEGAFTQALIDSIGGFNEVACLRVEDAPASRAESGYNFISNELFVGFATEPRTGRGRWLGVIPVSRTVREKMMTLQRLEAALSGVNGIGPSDYADDGMIQYLRTERVIPPYQTRGYKLIELVRIYEVEPASR